MFKIQVVKINIVFEFGLKACKKRRQKRLNEDSGVTLQLQMAVVYIGYRLYSLREFRPNNFWNLKLNKN